MPSIAQEDEDPVIAEYDVYLTKPVTATFGSSDPRLLLLQYPSHRPLSRPYNISRGQKPTALRLKPETGLLELDVPIITHEHYNVKAGIKQHRALKEAGVTKNGGTYGLAGGFNTTGAGYPQPLSIHEIPAYEEDLIEEQLDIQTLGGKIPKPVKGDPIYMLGSIRNDEIHLSHLDALVQVRPQLHHLDAQDELERKRTIQNAVGNGKAKPGIEARPKLETKAIDIKLKDKTYDERDRGINANARLLRSIQAEAFRTFDWIDEDEPASWTAYTSQLQLPTDTPGETTITKLQSKLSNSDWLDRISAPRETGHGKKGLLGKLRGRERERARRKKTEEERRRKANVNEDIVGTTDVDRTAPGGMTQDEDDEDSDLTDLDEMMDETEIGEGRAEKGTSIFNAHLVDNAEDFDLKENTEVAPKKRGRPKKS